MTTKMQAFCDHYLRTNDGPKSLLAAGYNVTPHNARIQANALLRHPEVVAYVTHEQEIQLIRKQATADALIDELSKIAFSDIRDVASWGPNGITLKPSNELDSDTAAAISEISESKAGAPAKIKLHDKMNALAQLARILGLNNDKVHVTHDISGLSDAELVSRAAEAFGGNGSTGDTVAGRDIPTEDREPLGLPERSRRVRA